MNNNTCGKGTCHANYKYSILTIGMPKIFLTMKLTLLLILFGCLQIKASVYSQQVSLSEKKASLEKIIKKIRKQTGYAFFYDAAYLQKAAPVSVDVHQVSINEALTKVFEGQPFTWEVLENTILIKPSAIRYKKNMDEVQPTIDIRGKVVSESGEPLPGASINVKGTTIGTSADANGEFFLKSIDSRSVLVVSHTGFKTQEVVVGASNELLIELSAILNDLDEVIVVGYGTTKRKDFVGSVGSLNLENSPVALAPNLNVLEALKGSISGLNIGATNSAGGQPSMQIRGQNSISGDNNPLIVLDGVIFMGSLSDINPNDIATIDVLKDATSAAAYGSRSANGVIAITTKRGKTGKPVITFNTSTGFQNWQNKPVMLRGEEWIDMVNARNQYTPGTTNWMKSGELANRENGKEIVWLDEVSRTGAMQNYQAAISGATENINYYLSTSYDDNKGIVVDDKFNRIALMGKLNANITQWLEIGVDAGFSKRDYSGVTADLAQAQMMSPYGVMYRDDQGNLEKYPYTQAAINPLWGINDGLRDNDDRRYNYRLNTRAVVKVPWVKGLSYRANYLLNQDQNYYLNFQYEGLYVQEGESPNRYNPNTIQGFLTNANGSINTEKTYSYVFDNIINYNNSFGFHDLDVTLVATRDYQKYEQVISSGSDFAANGNTALGVQGLHKATVQRIDLNGRERSNIGYLGRVNYSFHEKYYVTGSYRRDGASVFGVDNKWADFFGAGASWRISAEPFMLSFSALNDLKLKFSWGQNGNQGVGPYGTLSVVANAASGGTRYQFSNTPGQIYYGLYQSSIGNTLLGWEKTTSWNTGFESAWLDNRLFVDLDVYFAKTTDQIFTRNIPVMTGFKTMVTSMGQVNNRGVEATLRTVNLQNDNMTWSTTLTFWKNVNKLVSLYGEDLDGDGREDDDIANSLFIGKSLESIYGYEQIGIVQESDIEYIALTGAAPGAPKYRDIDGVDGITAADRTILGNGKENFRLNFSSNLAYKNFGFYMMITGTFGGNNTYLRSNPSAYLVSGTGRFNDNVPDIPYWTPENQSNTYPSAIFAGDGRFLGLQNRGFVRVQDVTLSYSFNQTWLASTRINSLKVFATAKNLGTFTNWFGGDPETGTRIRESTLPVASTYSLGVNLSF
ncbi:SusC/RagA family TonB-linked outer membrane protein [Olivibacter sitiensis]|uniref:SusC/RagA family TonB-linked outer membrane protein n=1 Tax=Olivibacter sitiensis TaxID=376470 RepID=UPI00041EEB9D|nr:SusC/RagA family TonB-linked outer membrane protein [Olivibacter sitiensis]